MDPWIAFDDARARWELERNHRIRVRDQRWIARQELVTHALVFAVVNLALWLLWGTSGAGLVWPFLLTAPWSIGLAVAAWRYRSLPREDAQPAAPVPSAISTVDRA